MLFSQRGGQVVLRCGGSVRVVLTAPARPCSYTVYAVRGTSSSDSTLQKLVCHADQQDPCLLDKLFDPMVTSYSGTPCC